MFFYGTQCIFMITLTQLGYYSGFFTVHNTHNTHNVGI